MVIGQRPRLTYHKCEVCDHEFHFYEWLIEHFSLWHHGMEPVLVEDIDSEIKLWDAKSRSYHQHKARIKVYTLGG